jgi:hypothetical protein
MSDGITDCARYERHLATQAAKKAHPELEVHDWDWTRYVGWARETRDYLLRMLRLKDDQKEPCPRCRGLGVERVVYVQETYIKHIWTVEDWPCRDCYGAGVRPCCG